MSAGAAVVKVDGVVSVEICARGDAIGVAGPQGANCPAPLDGEPEWVGVFSEAVDVRVGGKGGLDAEELGLEYERVVVCGEEGLACGPPEDGEGEGGLGEAEVEVGGARGDAAALGTREDVFWDFVPFVLCVGDG